MAKTNWAFGMGMAGLYGGQNKREKQLQDMAIYKSISQDNQLQQEREEMAQMRLNAYNEKIQKTAESLLEPDRIKINNLAKHHSRKIQEAIRMNGGSISKMMSNGGHMLLNEYTENVLGSSQVGQYLENKKNMQFLLAASSNPDLSGRITRRDMESMKNYMNNGSGKITYSGLIPRMEPLNPDDYSYGQSLPHKDFVGKNFEKVIAHLKLEYPDTNLEALLNSEDGGMGYLMAFAKQYYPHLGYGTGKNQIAQESNTRAWSADERAWNEQEIRVQENIIRQMELEQRGRENSGAYTGSGLGRGERIIKGADGKQFVVDSEGNYVRPADDVFQDNNQNVNIATVIATMNNPNVNPNISVQEYLTAKGMKLGDPDVSELGQAQKLFLGESPEMLKETFMVEPNVIDVNKVASGFKGIGAPIGWIMKLFNADEKTVRDSKNLDRHLQKLKGEKTRPVGAYRVGSLNPHYEYVLETAYQDRFTKGGNPGEYKYNFGDGQGVYNSLGIQLSDRLVNPLAETTTSLENLSKSDMQFVSFVQVPTVTTSGLDGTVTTNILMEAESEKFTENLQNAVAPKDENGNRTGEIQMKTMILLKDPINKTAYYVDAKLDHTRLNQISQDPRFDYTKLAKDFSKVDKTVEQAKIDIEGRQIESSKFIDAVSDLLYSPEMRKERQFLEDFKSEGVPIGDNAYYGYYTALMQELFAPEVSAEMNMRETGINDGKTMVSQIFTESIFGEDGTGSLTEYLNALKEKSESASSHKIDNMSYTDFLNQKVIKNIISNSKADISVGFENLIRMSRVIDPNNIGFIEKWRSAAGYDYSRLRY